MDKDQYTAVVELMNRSTDDLARELEAASDAELARSWQSLQNNLESIASHVPLIPTESFAELNQILRRSLRKNSSEATYVELFAHLEIVGIRQKIILLRVPSADCERAIARHHTEKIKRAILRLFGKDATWEFVTNTFSQQQATVGDQKEPVCDEIEINSGRERKASNRKYLEIYRQLQDDNHEHIFEIAGVIKWFDVSKGYGFIVPDSAAEDVLLHEAVLRASGYFRALRGARIVVEVARQPRGLQALRVVFMDDTNDELNSASGKEASRDEPAGDWQRARVKWFNRVRNFGFLQLCDSGEEVFVHGETLQKFGFISLAPDQFCQVRCGASRNGLITAEIKGDTTS